MIYGITYCEENMTISGELCKSSMEKNGFDNVRLYRRHEINGWFDMFNYKTLSAKRGAGYYLWKPYFINEAIGNCQDGDYLIYSDAGCEWIESPTHIVNVMTQDIFLFCNGHRHVEWSKSDVNRAICGDVSFDQMQVQASIVFFRVNEYTRNFVKEWLLFGQMPGFIDDSPSKIPNVPTFAENRYDQAILTALAIRDGIEMHWWADHLWFETQRYRWPNDKYPALVKHHRKRNPNSNTGDVEW